MKPKFDDLKQALENQGSEVEIDRAVTMIRYTVTNKDGNKISLHVARNFHPVGDGYDIFVKVLGSGESLDLDLTWVEENWTDEPCP